MTLYFKDEHFKTSVPLAITAMLVMYTLNNSISSNLPLTSYIKLMDIWLLFGLILPFFIVILLVIIEHLPHGPNPVRVESENSLKDKLMASNKWIVQFSRFHLPIIEVVFVIVYFAIALAVW